MSGRNSLPIRDTTVPNSSFALIELILNITVLSTHSAAMKLANMDTILDGLLTNSAGPEVSSRLLFNLNQPGCSCRIAVAL